MIKLYVGLTDLNWFEQLSADPTIGEVNFWQPGGSQLFRALRPGELFLFKLHSPLNFIVGGGVFAHASLFPVSLAWEAFGRGNGATSLDEMRARIGKYRRQTIQPGHDYTIGCRLLEQPFFFPRHQWIPVPASWSPNIVVGKSFEAENGDGRYIWDAVQDRLPYAIGAAPAVAIGVEAPKYAPPRLIAPRLGQGTFRIAVTDNYERRCAVTGERTLPILDAAHIRPYASDGTHDVRNGILLRTDVHRLFDLHYVTVTPEGRFEVSARLKQDFDNGRHYYELHGREVRMPRQPFARPSREALVWHSDRLLA